MMNSAPAVVGVSDGLVGWTASSRSNRGFFAIAVAYWARVMSTIIVKLSRCDFNAGVPRLHCVFISGSDGSGLQGLQGLTEARVCDSELGHATWMCFPVISTSTDQCPAPRAAKRPARARGPSSRAA